ncbi:hypothetical protein EYC80_010809 [Monilinia laxa]|uniref:Uncharacterized protein n=1 Tax=Monilinia laxa TaxID=61186 RepID=A0A5N6JQQ3_MONLA|nr:hypothetical protein EYC80_010809 [Monilinia laxa]
MGKGELSFRGSTPTLLCWPPGRVLNGLSDKDRRVYDALVTWHIIYRQFRHDVPEGDEELLRLGSGNYQRLFPGYPIINTLSGLESRLYSVRRDLRRLLERNNIAIGFIQATAAADSSQIPLTPQQQQEVQDQSHAYDQAAAATSRVQNSTTISLQAGSSSFQSPTSRPQMQRPNDISSHRHKRLSMSSRAVAEFYSAQGLTPPERRLKPYQSTSTGTGIANKSLQVSISNSHPTPRSSLYGVSPQLERPALLSVSTQRAVRPEQQSNRFFNASESRGVEERISIQDSNDPKSTYSPHKMTSQVPQNGPRHQEDAETYIFPTIFESSTDTGRSALKSGGSTLPASPHCPQAASQDQPTVYRRPTNNKNPVAPRPEDVIHLRQMKQSEYSLTPRARPSQERTTLSTRQPSHHFGFNQHTPRNLSQYQTYESDRDPYLPPVNAQGRHPLPTSPIQRTSVPSITRSNREALAPAPALREMRSRGTTDEGLDADTQTDTRMSMRSASRTVNQPWLDHQPPKSDARSTRTVGSPTLRAREPNSAKENDVMAKYYSDLDDGVKLELWKYNNKYRE